VCLFVSLIVVTMFSSHSLAFYLLKLAALAAAQSCDLQFDGRVPADFTPDTFDTQNDVFSPDNVFGASKSLPSHRHCSPNI
jgi:hypothetical protein